jgi:hypothetical protein
MASPYSGQRIGEAIKGETVSFSKAFTLGINFENQPKNNTARLNSVLKDRLVGSPGLKVRPDSCGSALLKPILDR